MKICRFERQAGTGLVFLGAVVASSMAVAHPYHARAHPHVWIEAAIELDIVDETLNAVTIDWLFDRAYTVFALDGLAITEANLQALAASNLESLADWSYFTEVIAPTGRVPFGRVTEFSTELRGNFLAMTFTIPLESPVHLQDTTVQVSTYDPTYYIAIDPAGLGAITMTQSMPASCSLSLNDAFDRPEDLQLASTLDLLDLGPNDRPGRLFATFAVVDCGS